MQCWNLCLATFSMTVTAGAGADAGAREVGRTLKGLKRGWRGGWNGAGCDYMHRCGAGTMELGRVWSTKGSPPSQLRPLWIRRSIWCALAIPPTTCRAWSIQRVKSSVDVPDLSQIHTSTKPDTCVSRMLHACFTSGSLGFLQREYKLMRNNKRMRHGSVYRSSAQNASD